MSFPIAPVDGEVYKEYSYNSTQNIWQKGSSFPIGFIFTQLPGKSSPIDLGLPGTWDNISATYAGDFFRVEGGNASAFESGKQTDQNKEHNHSLRDRPPWLFSEVVTGSSVIAEKTVTAVSVAWSTEDSGGDEARPVNQTTRIWERIS